MDKEMDRWVDRGWIGMKGRMDKGIHRWIDGSEVDERTDR